VAFEDAEANFEHVALVGGAALTKKKQKRIFAEGHIKH
jgi:hypothetical protein